MCYSEDVNTKKSKSAAGSKVGGGLTKAVATATLRAFRTGSTDSTESSSSMTSNNSSLSNSDYGEEWNDSPTPSRAQEEDDTHSFGSTDSNNNKVMVGGDVAVRSSNNRNQNQTSSPSLSLLAHIGWMATGVLAAAAKIGFSLWFPFALAPKAANATYHWAFYNYDPAISHFDNTIWTYGTDYGLAVITAILAVILLKRGHGSTSAHSLVYRMATLLLLYCASVTAGGYAHQFFLTLKDRNTSAFRLTWTICVGTVCAASTAMGMSGSNMLRQFQHQVKTSAPNHQNFGSNALLHRIPVLPDTFWIAFGIAVTVFCAWGGLSFQRPACDIFVAGITQTPSTFYIMMVFGLVQHKHVSNRAKILGLMGFIGNAPLLPAYPLFVQYSNLSLGTVNALLHSCLCTSWTMQGISVLQMTRALIRHEREQQEEGSQVQKQSKKTR